MCCPVSATLKEAATRYETDFFMRGVEGIVIMRRKWLMRAEEGYRGNKGKKGSEEEWRRKGFYTLAPLSLSCPEIILL